jgi:hypothetical protein
MDEILTYDQIKARYAPDWVLIGDLVTDENLDVLSGKVLFHSPDHEEVWHKVAEFKPGRFAVECLGTYPEGMECKATVLTGGSAQVVPLVVVTRLSALGQHRLGFPVVAHSLPAGALADGLLGLDLLQNQVLTIDFRAGQITLA